MKKKLKDKVFNIRLATEKDIDTINNFDKNIFRTVNRDFYNRHNKKNILKNLKRGKIFLVFYKNKLVSWAAIILEGDKKYCYNYNLTEKEIKNSGCLVAASVSKRFRGYGLQKFLIEKRLDYLKKNKIKFALISVHPENKYSLNNIVLTGFKFVRKTNKNSKNKYLNYYVLNV